MTEPKGEGQDRLLDHDYDGIHEYDNPLPGWWTLLFWATVAFSVLYWINLPGVGTGKGRIANYEAEMAKWHEQHPGTQAAAPAHTDDALRAMARDAGAVALGKATFETNCAVCHRPDGGGNIGPNLTDEWWLHGGRPGQILATVTNGVPEKGMLAWGPILKPEQLPAVTAFVLTLRGTRPPDAKAPQGVKEEPGAAPGP